MWLCNLYMQKNILFYKELQFYKDVLPMSRIHAIEILYGYLTTMQCLQITCKKSSLSLSSVCYMTQGMGTLIKLSCN